MNRLPVLPPQAASHARARDAITQYVVSRKMAVGDKLPPQAELVKALNCSETTIQKAMKDLVDEGIVRREVGRGTYLLRLPDVQYVDAVQFHAQPVYGRVAICALDDHEARPSYSPGLEILHAAEQRFLEQGGVIETRLAVCAHLQELDDLVKEVRPDGLVLDWRFDPLDKRAWDIQQYCFSLDIPVVHGFHAYHPEVQAAQQICVDNQAIAYRAMEHLAAQGHQHIMIAASGYEHGFQTLRLSAAKHFCKVTGTRHRIATSAHVRRDREWLEAGRAAFASWKDYPAEDRPSAVFAMNDQVGLAFAAEARKAGLRVPGDISIIGVDNDMHFRLQCGIDLTTLDPCRADIGDRAAAHILDLMRTRATNEHTVIRIQPKLVNRGSTAPHQA